jgi:hypothetical protein
MLAPQTPGVYRTEVLPPSVSPLSTGVPAFLGLATAGELEVPQRLRLFSEFDGRFVSPAMSAGFLRAAVEGFFVNGGDSCFVVRLNEALGPEDALASGLAAIADLDDIDLVCVPDVSRLRDPPVVAALPPERVQALQRLAVDHCERVGTRIAILDSLPGAGQDAVLRQRATLISPNATLYHPWILTHSDGADEPSFTPPCGHVAGIYSRTDRASGVHKAPANEVAHGAFDLERDVTNDLQAGLNAAGVNCLRAFPGRGIRVWGARTLATDPSWVYVNVRRLILTVARSISVLAAPLLFEPQGEPLWRRIRRELAAYLTGLHRQGALRGASPDEAFFVRCDAETNAGAEQGCMVVQLGLAAARPNEFVVVHFVQQAGGVSVEGPNRST